MRTLTLLLLTACNGSAMPDGDADTDTDADTDSDTDADTDTDTGPQTIALGELPIETLGTVQIQTEDAAAAMIDGVLHVRFTGRSLFGDVRAGVLGELVAYDDANQELDRGNVSLRSDTWGLYLSPGDLGVHGITTMRDATELPARLTFRYLESDTTVINSARSYVDDYHFFDLGTDNAFMEGRMCDPQMDQGDRVRMKCIFVDGDGAPTGWGCGGHDYFDEPEADTDSSGCATLSTPTMPLPTDVVPVFFPF